MKSPNDDGTRVTKSVTFVGHVSWLKGVVPVRSLTVPVSPYYFTAALVNNIQ